MTVSSPQGVRRNKSFNDTHRELIESAVKLIAERGVEALSIAALAREVGINRTTVYYHFDSRDQLIAEVKAWSSSQLDAFYADRPIGERIDHIYHFVLENPVLLKMWIDDYLAVGDIRTLYPSWDDLVAGIRERFSRIPGGEDIDPEVFCVNLLTSAFIGPLVFRNSVRPDADIDTVVARFKAESLRMLQGLSLLQAD